jgi:hypothetical protein
MEANWGDFYPLYYQSVKREKENEASTAVDKLTHCVHTSVSI